MDSKTIRKKFLDYYKDKGHQIISSSRVIPFDDPTLLFTNAGMNQFKDLFLGKESREYLRAATSQKCIRAGGKHNDLENVGHTRRHLTFFEMLGNFSFADYFKKEAIDFAWELSTKVLGLDPQRIWPSVFEKDEEAFSLWTAYVPSSRICKMGEKDNFWSMGETGPCGPCSELYYDLGGDGPGAPHEDPDGVRFLEFWNLVFMEFNRREDGELEKLPKPSIDTGMGLERVASILSGVDSVYDTDILRGIIGGIEKLFQKEYRKDSKSAPSFRVIADHLRTLAFAIADGAQPSNVDRGYVLRKILRRAVRYGRELGAEGPFLAKIVPTLIDYMGEDYKELIEAKERIQEILTQEEALFFRTLKKGEGLLHKIVEKSLASNKILGGEEIFLLKDTFGFPVDEVELLAVDFGLKLDLERYQLLEKEAKERSKKGQKETKREAELAEIKAWSATLPTTEFVGYRESLATTAILSISSSGHSADFLQEGEEGICIVEKSPFYAEMGGQVGDTGVIRTEEGDLFEVFDTKQVAKGVTGHMGRVVKGRFETGQTVTAEINRMRRRDIENNHTATHLLHYALVEVIGPHIKQAGSLVEVDHFRFDFSHHKPLSSGEVEAIEDLVNEKIRENSEVTSYQLSFEEASKKGEIKQFFGEKYGLQVRVIDIPFEKGASKELCGGTHVPTSLGRIGLFRITKESGIAQGVRRIEAMTGAYAEAFGRGRERLLEELSSLLKTPEERVIVRVKEIIEEGKKLKKEIESFLEIEAKKRAQLLLEKGFDYKGKKILLFQEECTVEGANLLIDLLYSKENVVAIVALVLDKGKARVVIRCKESFVKEGHEAHLWLKELLPFIQGQGGGKASSAQGQGIYLQGIEALFAHAQSKIEALCD